MHADGPAADDEAAAVRKDAGRLTDVLRELLAVQPNTALIDRSRQLFDSIMGAQSIIVAFKRDSILYCHISIQCTLAERKFFVWQFNFFFSFFLRLYGRTDVPTSYIDLFDSLKCLLINHEIFDLLLKLIRELLIINNKDYDFPYILVICVYSCDSKQ